MKKIDIITKAMTSGGAERVIAQLANYFTEKDISCRIITTENGEVMYPLHEKVDVVAIGKKSDNKAIDRILRYKEVRNIVQANKPDVVLTMPEDTGIYAILALIGTGIPVYVSERNNPWVMPDVKITRLLRKVAYPFAKGIIFQTQIAKSFFPPYIQKKGIVLQNPVDATRIPKPYIGERKKQFVAVGRLEKQKNFPLLINAFAKFCEDVDGYELVIYGEGNERENLENLINKLQLTGHVQLPGRDFDVLNKINDSAAFILSSDYEGMPNALIEAMCMGMPVISTDCPSGGPKELITDGINGILIPVNDLKKLVDAMKTCTKREVAEELSAEALQLKETLTSDIVFEQWHDFLLMEEKKQI